MAVKAKPTSGEGEADERDQVLEVDLVRLLLHLGDRIGDVVDLRLRDACPTVERARPPLAGEDEREVG
jgi:hypothetical protein